MKKAFGLITVLGALIITTSCSTDYKEKVEELKARLIADKIESDRRTQYLTDSLEWVLSSNLIEIEKDINGVLEKNGVMIGSEGDNVEDFVSTKDEIKSRIQNFSELLKHNKSKIDHLISKLDKVENKNEELIASLERTKLRIEEQESTIEDLFITLEDERARYSTLDVGFRLLRAQNDSLSTSLADLDGKIHTAYFVVGDFKELKDRGVLGREGGILSIGAAHALESDFNDQQFSRVDIREKLKVEVGAKKAELITEHPTDSYNFQWDGKEVAYLEITDPDEFWKASKYMVLEVN